MGLTLNEPTSSQDYAYNKRHDKGDIKYYEKDDVDENHAGKMTIQYVELEKAKQETTSK